MSGLTLKQFAQREFFAALDGYRDANKAVVADEPGSAEALVRASIRIHAAKSGVPKRLWPLVNKKNA